MTTPLETDGLPEAVAADVPPLPPPGAAPPLPPPGAVPRPPVPALTRFPALAAFLSVVPGLGHLYAGAYQRAAMVVIGLVAVLVVVPLPVNVFFALFLWFFGIFDSYRQAQVSNLEVLGGTVPTAAGDRANLSFGVFLTVVGLILLLKNLLPVDLDWLRDWWPVVPVLIGLYLVASAVVERARRRPPEGEDGSR